MAAALAEHPVVARWLPRLYANSGIETRYSCLPDESYPPAESAFSPGRPLAEIATTAERLVIYERESVAVGTEAARQALDDFAAASGAAFDDVAQSVTHLIVVSCTGFFAPGLDQLIVRGLQLSPTVERTLIGFMGCSAAFNALRAANHIVRSRPDARVLVVCVELCSLHIQPGVERENLIAASLFADGAAACLVGAPPAQHTGDFFRIDAFYTAVQPDTQSDMVWQIGNHGFVLRLSPQVPEHLAVVAPTSLRRLFEMDEHPAFWAIHPGGRAIVDRLQAIFALCPDDVAPSRNVLRRYGNMSSPTILFVLREMRERLRQRVHEQPAAGVAMAFGPGLVIEMARLSYVPRG